MRVATTRIPFFKLMKKLSLIFACCLSIIAFSCTKSQDEWVVKGSTSLERLNGQQVFIVPCNPSSMTFSSKHYEDSIGVDSVYIENGQFEFRGKGEFLARITVDKMVRYGTQDLMIVTEPGYTITVEIDSVSHGGGSPQNEALEKWKTMKIAHDAITGPKVQQAYHLRHLGDSATAQAISDSLKIFNEQFRQEVLDIAKILGKGTAYDVLMNRYGR